MKRINSSRTGKRRSHLALKKTQSQACAKCKAAVLPHHACANCGTYKGKAISSLQTKA